MLLSSVASKVRKNGFEVINEQNGCFKAIMPGCRYEIVWSRNGGSVDAVCLGIKNRKEESDPLTDYCPIWFFDSINKAIDKCLEMGFRKASNV